MDDYEPDLISISDEDGNEFDCEILDELDYEDEHYLVLLPVEESEDEDENGAYSILQEVMNEDGTSDLLAVEDDELLDKLDAVFQEHFQESLEETDAEEEEIDGPDETEK